ncbi:MAG: 54S ribosomal protein L22, mitochondrial [Chaenotheca gracillima]|nr:MAG: 54S ribosomal protein L22, mitochondrial [Chaenotheca gracillima]
MDPSDHVQRPDGSSNAFYTSGENIDPYYTQAQTSQYASGWDFNPPYGTAQSGHASFDPRGTVQYQHPAYPQPMQSQDPTQPTPYGQFGRAFPENGYPQDEQSMNSHAFKTQSPYATSASPYNAVNPYQSPLYTNQNTPTPGHQSAPAQSNHENTVAPQAVYSPPKQLWEKIDPAPNGKFDQMSLHSGGKSKENDSPEGADSPEKALERFPSPPPGAEVGHFTFIDPDQLKEKTGATSIPDGPFVFVGPFSGDVPATKGALVPKYNPRRSRNDIRRFMLSGDPTTWTTSQKHVAKKLKLATPRDARPRPPLPAVRDRPSTSQPEEVSSDSSSESEEETDSEYESSNEEEEPEEPPPLPSTRPKEPLEAVKYDSIKALWRPPRRLLAGSDIREGLSEYWQVIRVIRDDWTAAEKANDAAKTAAQRDRLLSAISAAVEFGHKDILEKLSETGAFISVWCKVLRDRIKEDDTNSKAVINTLELISLCFTISESLLEQVKFSKLQARLVKKGNSRVKELLKRIRDNAAADTKRKAEDAKSRTDAVPKTKDTTASDRPRQTSDQVAGVKRPRSELDVGNGQSPKKAAPSSSTTSNSNVASLKSPTSQERKAGLAATQKAPVKAVAGNVVKPKTTPVPQKPSSFFTGLQSASKVKPAAPVQKQPTQASGVANKGGAPTASMGSSRPAFSLSETLASLNKPKEPESKAENTSKDPPETAEEKQKRLRKEQRRKLRVTFKPDTSLVDVRYFTHDQAEEIGREDNLVRDAGDAMEEGRMFKQHMDVDAMDEDEEILASEEQYRPYPTLDEVDFHLIPENERDRNCSTRGQGRTPVDSPESLAQDERETKSLMVVYTSLADIPFSPREPSKSDDSEFSPELSFGDPPDWIKNREEKITRSQSAQPSQQIQTPSGTDLSAFLNTLNKQPNQQPAAAQPQLTELEKIFAMHSAGAAQSSAPPQLPPAVSTQNQVPDWQALLANIVPQNNQGMGQSQAATQQPQLQDILAQLVQPNSVQNQGYGSQSQSQNTSSSLSDGQRRNQGWGGNDGAADYENRGPSDYGYGDSRRQNNNYGAKKGQKRVMKPCKFHHEGRCKKGNDCQFLHD